jgi:hypothetical protein
MPLYGGSYGVVYREAVHAAPALSVMYDVDDYYADLADSGNLTTAPFILGICISGVSAGGIASILRKGEYIDPTNSLTRGPLFLGTSGALRSTPPATGTLVRMGFASSVSRMIVDVQFPINL